MIIMSVDKEDLSAKINALLGIKDNPIDFSKLSKKDMERLHDAVETLTLGGGILSKRLLNKPVQQIMNMPLRDLIKEFKDGSRVGPLRGILGSLLDDRGQ